MNKLLQKFWKWYNGDSAEAALCRPLVSAIDLAAPSLNFFRRSYTEAEPLKLHPEPDINADGWKVVKTSVGAVPVEHWNRIVRADRVQAVLLVAEYSSLVAEWIRLGKEIDPSFQSTCRRGRDYANNSRKFCKALHRLNG